MADNDESVPRIVLIDVDSDALPAVLRARLVPGAVISGSDRFRPASRRSVVAPLLRVVFFMIGGLLALWATVSLGFDSQSGGVRFVYAGLAGALLLAAVFGARSFVHAWAHRGDSSRLGCHVVAREGVLIAERGRCTWVPRGWLPAPVDDPSTDTRFGEGGALLLISDGQGSIKRWPVPRRVGAELDLWRRVGVMPDW